MKNFSNKKNGFSLVEMLIGITILIIVLTGGFVALRSISRGVANNILRLRAQRKLQTVTDRIRQESIGGFSTMTSGDYTCPPNWTSNPQKYCPDTELRIKVFASFGAVDPATRTRPVTLTASWNDGVSDHTKTTIFSISPLRGKVYGGRITAKVIWANGPHAGEGVPGVTLTAAGQETDTVSNITDNYGNCLVEGLRLPDLAHPISTVTYSATNIGYFATSGSENTANAGSWQKTIYITGVKSNSSTPVPDQTLYALTSVSGKIIDIKTGLGAPGVTLAIFSHYGSLVVAGSPWVDQNANTDTSGNIGHFQFSGLVPGQYSLHVLGSIEPPYGADASYKYAAVAVPWDMYNWPTNPSFLAASGVDANPVIPPSQLQTAERGSLSYQVRGLEFNSTGIVTSTVTPNADFSMGFWNQVTTTWGDWGSSYAQYNCIPWYVGYVVARANLMWSPVSGGSGEIDHIVPNVLMVDNPTMGSDTLLNEFGFTELLMDYEPNFTNVTPVIVFNSNGSLNNSISATSLRYFYDDPFIDQSAPVNNRAYVQVYAGGLVSANQNKQIYLLGKNSYANITGNILDGTIAGSPNYDPASHPSFSTPYVEVRAGNGGWAYLAAQPYPYSYGHTRIISSQQIPLDGGGGTPYTFDFRKPDSTRTDYGYNPLPPTVGDWTDPNTQTNVLFRTGGASATPKPFHLQFQAYTKTWDPSLNSGQGGIVANTYTNFNPSENFTVNFYEASAPWSGWSVSETKSTTANSSGTDDVSKSITIDTQLLGYSGPLLVPPGSTQNVTITATASSAYRQYYVGLVDNADFTFQLPTDGKYGYLYTYDGASQYINSSGTPLVVLKKGKATIHGTIRDTAHANAPLYNAVVYLSRSGFGAMNNLTDAMNTLTAADGSFTFSNVDFVMSPGNNFAIYVRKTGYNDTGWINTFRGTPSDGGGYDGMNYTYPDIGLDLTPVGGNPTGGF